MLLQYVMHCRHAYAAIVTVIPEVGLHILARVTTSPGGVVVVRVRGRLLLPFINAMPAANSIVSDSAVAFMHSSCITPL